LGEDGSKMSKSKGNTVDPDEIIRVYGADALRMFEMFLGPLEDMKPWNTRGIEGLARFLRRTFRLFITEAGEVDPKWKPGTEARADTLRILHETLKKVSTDIETLRFNTAISQLMVCLNHLAEAQELSIETGKVFLQMIAPFAPHIAEELWERIGEKPSICDASWPTWDERFLVKTEFKIVVQVGGKLRGEFMTAIDSDETTVVAQAKGLPEVAKFLEGKTIVKTVYVAGKLVNFVVR
ncbi:MAG TPA: class I tRNA ligase family protein, partial [Opitutales bacterium]|nr:class I tRNA ligase family protein [Opitutales bacterium]